MMQWECKKRLCVAYEASYFSVGEDEGQEEEMPIEGPLVVETRIPVSSTPFGEVQLKLPVKEEEIPPSKETREMSSKEIPGSKPLFGEVQVEIFLRFST